MIEYCDSSERRKRFDLISSERRMRQRTEDMIEVGNKAEAEDGMDRGIHG
jgi:hypothetical protein